MEHAGPGPLMHAKTKAFALKTYFPGLSVAVIIGLSASFLSEHYNSPAMLLAILIGLALHFLSDDPRSAAGLAFASTTLLRVGIALLGLRVTTGMFQDLGLIMILALVASVGLTICFGVILSRFAGKESRFGFLSAAAVAICGASAAMAVSQAISGVSGKEQDEQMVFVVIGVTMLSTLAMIVYPVLTGFLGFDDHATGLFLGATIHDVAQVAGAGFSVSTEAGETAVFVKLIRVTLLGPVVLLAALSFPSRRNEGAARRPFVPGFVIAFMVLAVLNSVVALPEFVGEWSGTASRWALLIAISAVGVRTSIPAVLKVGRRAIGILIVETAFLGLLVLGAIYWLGLH